MASVDIVIPLYNKQATIEQAVRSVQSQTVTDWRLIVVDDGSTDGSTDVVRRLQGQDPRIELIQQPNSGPGTARNTGIRAAAADYVAFLDADDLWYPEHLKTALEAITQNEAAMVGTMYYQWPRQVSSQAQWLQRGIQPGIYTLRGDEDPEWVEAFIVLFHVNTTLIKTDIARRYGFFEAGCKYGEDLIFFAKVIFNTAFMLVGGQPTAQYNRQHSELTGHYAFALPPMLVNPEILLADCPPEKKNLARRVLARLALRTAYHKARNGYKEDALKLIQLHPLMKEFAPAWRQCHWAVRLSWILPYWVRFKCWLEPKVRSIIK